MIKKNIKLNPKTFRIFGFFLGLFLALLVYLFAPELAIGVDGDVHTLSQNGRIILMMMTIMAVWWVLEVIPIYVTALLPLLILPITGTQNFPDTAVSYGHSIIFLALGGFFLAAALERWDIHKKFANGVLSLVGNDPKRLIGGFMFASAVLSMWISNTAAAIIMLPIALSVIHAHDKESGKSDNFAPCLLLAICYACSMGGMTTLIGTTTNMFFAGYMETVMGHEISFIRWMAFSGPVALIMLLLIWWLLTYILLPVKSASPTKGRISNYLLDTIPWTRDSIATLLVFLLVALSWIAMPLINKIPGLQHLTMYIVAVIGILLLFSIPASSQPRGLLDWKTASGKIPWGVLLLIGGGLSLARAFSNFGVSEYLALQVSAISVLPLFFIFLAIITLMVFLTEVTSNVASVTALTPVFAAMAFSLGVNSTVILASITLAASCAFMLPVATPPNAVIFGSERVGMTQMVRAGFILNIVGIIVITVWSYFFGANILLNA